MKLKKILAIACSGFALAATGLLLDTERAEAFWPACSWPNTVSVGGDGAGPATVEQSLELAKIKLEHPAAQFCSGLVEEVNVDTFIEWPDPAAKAAAPAIAEPKTTTEWCSTFDGWYTTTLEATQLYPYVDATEAGYEGRAVPRGTRLYVWEKCDPHYYWNVIFLDVRWRIDNPD